MEFSWIAFDTETSGAYPFRYDIIELAALKYQGSIFVDSIQFFIAPEGDWDPEAEKIHGISRETLMYAPTALEVLPKIQDFFQVNAIVAHHAPFDLGFLTPFWKKNGRREFPNSINLCTSLLSRGLIQSTENYKLQTLARHFQIPSGQAHRALDDARVCAEIFMRLWRFHPEWDLDDWYQYQKVDLSWKRFDTDVHPRSEEISYILGAINKNQRLKIVPRRGQFKGNELYMQPLGLVLTPIDGDYVPGVGAWDQKKKRFPLEDYDFLAS